MRGRRPSRRIVIIGADGFIGSHLTRIAVSSGASVTAVCVNGDWRLRGIKGIDTVPVTGGRWWSTAFEPTLRRCLRGSDTVALLAYSPARDQSPDAREEHERSTNVAGALRIVDLAAAHAVRLVFASSSEVYGNWHERPIAESTPVSPHTPYAKAKVVVERAVGGLARRIEGSCSLRIATVYGPGENGPRAIPSFMRAYLQGELPVIHGEGSDVRDYIHVRDVARAFLSACFTSPPLPEAVNVGSGEGRTTMNVLEEVASTFKRSPDARHVASPRPATRSVLDPKLASQTLEFRPQELFGAGLQEEARWLATRLGNGRIVASDPAA